MFSKSVAFLLMLCLSLPLIQADVNSTNTSLLSFTPEESAYLQDKKKITMCVDPDWMHFEKIENGEHIGMSAEYIQVISSKINTPITMFTTKTWTDSIAFAKARKCYIFSLAIETSERKKYMYFTRSYLAFPLFIITTNTKLFITYINTVLQ